MVRQRRHGPIVLPRCHPRRGRRGGSCLTGTGGDHLQWCEFERAFSERPDCLAHVGTVTSGLRHRRGSQAGPDAFQTVRRLTVGVVEPRGYSPHTSSRTFLRLASVLYCGLSHHGTAPCHLTADLAIHAQIDNLLPKLGKPTFECLSAVPRSQRSIWSSIWGQDTRRKNEDFVLKLHLQGTGAPAVSRRA